MASYTEQTLATNEKVVSINKVTKLAYLNAVANGIIWSTIIGIFAGPAGIVIGVLAGLLVAAAVWYERYTKEFSVTDKKILYKSGLIARNTDELMLSKIEGIDVKQPILGRLFGFGSLKITGPGQQVVKFTSVDNPMDVKNQIQSQIA